MSTQNAISQALKSLENAYNPSDVEDGMYQKWEAQGFVTGDRCRDVVAALNGQVTRAELNPELFGDSPPKLTKRPRAQVTPP